MVRSRTLPAALICVLVAAACAVEHGVQLARVRVDSGDLEGARRGLERELALTPQSVDLQVALGEVYYKLARDELDRNRDEAAYLLWLEKSVRQFLTSLELDPEDSRPHFYLGVMDTYGGDLHKALRGFKNARRLNPTGVADTNIAEIYIYMGHRHKARFWNKQGLRHGAPKSAAIFNDMLLSWKEGDIRKAERKFDTLSREYPDALRTINVARLPAMPNDFRDFASYCCRSPACGPYLDNACRDLSLDVYDEELSKEAMLQELRIEMEKQRRLNDIYRQRRDLKIDLEPLPEAPATP